MSGPGEYALDKASVDQQIEALNLTIEHLKQRKAHYKGIVERANVVLRAAWLLDDSSISTVVLADALLGDGDMTPAGPRVDRF